MRGFFLCVVLLILSVQYSFGQQNEMNLSKADSLVFYGKSKEAISYYEKGLREFQKTSQTQKQAEAHNGLSEAYLSFFRIEKAFFHANQALSLSGRKEANHIEEARAFDNIGRAHSLKRQAQKALASYEKALAIRVEQTKKDSLALATSFYHLAHAHHDLSEYEKALDYLQKALSLSWSETPKAIILQANIHESLGYVSYDKGNVDSALASFKKGLELAQQIYQETHPYFSKVYNQLGLIYSFRNEFNESLQYFQKALSVSIQNDGLDHPNQIKVHYNIGTVYHHQGNKDKAIYHTEKTLDLGKRVLPERHENFFFPLSQMGQILANEEGISYLKKALKIYEGKEERNSVRVSHLHQYLYVIYEKLGQLDLAFASAEKALKMRLNSFGKQNILSIRSYNHVTRVLIQQKKYEEALEYNQEALNANEKEGLNDPLLLESLKLKADIFFQLYEKSQKITYVYRCLSFYQKAIDLIEDLRIKRRNYQDKMHFSELTKAVYARAIECSWLIDNGDRYLKVNPFLYSEQSKSNALKELKQRVVAKKTSDIPEDIMQLEKGIALEIAEVTSKIVRVSNKSVVDSVELVNLNAELFDLRVKKDSLSMDIEERFPVYYEKKYEESFLSVSTLQKRLPDETTLVEFFRWKEQVYAFVITPTSFYRKKLQIEDLDKKIYDFTKSIVEKDKASFASQSFALYQSLIQPLESVLKGNQLIIVPDESLWNLPFDLLLTSPSMVNKENYLLHTYAISYANSASLLFQNSAGKPNQELKAECLAFSYSYGEDQSSILNLQTLRNSDVDLPGTRKEIKAISQVYDGKYYIGNEANEQQFKAEADQYQLIHLAVHGEIDAIDPFNSRIYFTQTEELEEREDNTLYAHELYALDIPADLVVLSACDTGSGKINKGEGVLSLGHAFQSAGAKSLLLSKWKISDKTTPDIMESFYQNIEQGMNKSVALQQAKLRFLEQSDVFNEAPFYWGSFYVLGDAAPINSGDSLWGYWWILLIVGLITFFLKVKC